jgi:hypothetical protein
VRRADWEGVETQGKAFLEYITQSSAASFAARRQEIAEQADRIVQFGVALPADFLSAQSAVAAVSEATDWSTGVQALGRLDGLLRSILSDYSTSVRQRAMALAAWAGLTGEALPTLDGHLRTALEPLQSGHVAEALNRVNEAITREMPTAAARRDAAREAGRSILAAAHDLGVPSEALEAALRHDAEAAPLDWAASTEGVESANALVAETLRGRVIATMESLAATLESLREYGVDPAEPLVRVAELKDAVATATPSEIPALLQSARAATEEPVVGIVAGLLDSVRARLVEARRLGRDASEVFAAMNRAREALRLKIYSEALAASQEAVDRVASITGDLDTAREEAESLAELLQRMAQAKFPTGPWTESLHRIRDHLSRVELEPARELLRATLHALGTEAATFFSDRLSTIERILPLAQERGFLPQGAIEDLAQVRQLLDEGRLGDAGELLGALEVRLRTAAGPHVASRLDELERGFSDIPDETLVAPVRRLLADTDVNLRVKEDLPAALESLKRAEREFTAVFAAHASSLVEMLEEERRALEAMGGAGDEIQRQIDEVQQIFNMGDFVKASRASQEIRTRAHQQQLIRSEEAVSHAKLALVELGQMGVDAGSLRGSLEQAQDAARAQRYAEAYRLAAQTQDAAQRLRAKAQLILDGLAEANVVLQELRQAGLSVEAHRERIRLAQAGYQALDFDGAKDTLDVLMALMRAEQANAETRRLLGEADLLCEDAQRLSVATEPMQPTLTRARAALEGGQSAEALAAVRDAHHALVQLLRPVLTEHIRALERDLEVARSAGLEVTSVLEMLGEARRRLTAPVPTGIAEIADAARSRLVETRGFLEHAERAVKRATDAFNEAELVHVPVAGARERVAQLEAALAKKEYARVIDLAASLEREMIQHTYQHVSKTLAGLQGVLVHARQSGSDTSVPENLLMQGRQALEEGRPLEALQFVARSEGELERGELQVRLAQASLSTVRQKVLEAEAEGIRARVASEKIAQADASFADHLYPVVLELAIDASDSLALARENFRRSREALDFADRQVKEGMELGADVGEVIGELDRARHAHQEGDYPEAIRHARESAERARWAIERLYAGALADLQQLLATAQGVGLAEALGHAQATVAEVETALKSREWKRATDLLQRGRAEVQIVLTQRLDARTGEVEALYRSEPSPSAAELEARDQARRRVAEERARGALPAALGIWAEEEARVVDGRRRELQARVTALRDRLWVGEKLGLDTTPVMELFSEAQRALQGGQLAPVARLVDDGEARLKELVMSRFDDKLRETQTELVFAQDGLHVVVADIGRRLDGLAEAARAGAVIESAQTLLEAGEELNRRKAWHRELLNLHYLIDAALARASERRLDTQEARKLLEESIRARGTDYAVALEKAREALRVLQGQLQGSDAGTVRPLWPFPRAPAPKSPP